MPTALILYSYEVNTQHAPNRVQTGPCGGALGSVSPRAAAEKLAARSARALVCRVAAIAWVLLVAQAHGQTAAQQPPAKGAAQARAAEPGPKPVARARAKPKDDLKVRKAKAGTKAAATILVGSGPSYAEQAPALAFAEQMARERELPAQWVRQVLTQARQSPAVISLMRPPSSPFVKNWRVYRSRFLDEVRINAGLRFWRTHEAELRRAETLYGVPAEIVVGIIGVETLYGRHMGQFRVIDALSTLAFDFPDQHPRAAERSAYFRKELEHFLVAHYRAKTDPIETLGSYAGATGLPQFMPSSIAHFAVDFDGDGRIDLRSSISDVIGSVAHYLKAFNWKPGMATHYPVQLKPDADLSALLAPDILPTFSAQAFQDKGATLTEPAASHNGPLALIELLNGTDAPSFVAGTENFYVITRYNWSSYYAMAVIELGQEIAARRSKPAP